MELVLLLLGSRAKLVNLLGVSRRIAKGANYELHISLLGGINESYYETGTGFYDENDVAYGIGLDASLGRFYFNANVYTEQSQRIHPNFDVGYIF